MTKKIEKANVAYFEVMELAIHICGLPEDADDDQVDEAMYDKFEMSMDKFHELIEILLPLAIVSKSPLTENIYQGFGANGVWLAKSEVKQVAQQDARPAYEGSGFQIENDCDADD